MNKMLVVVFDNESKASEGLNALRELDRNGDITLYATAVVSKDAYGKLTIKQAADKGPIGTATGFLTGSLIGLLGGPVGLAIGAGVGMVTGLAFDVSEDDTNVTFVDEVSDALAHGQTAIIAEIEEAWTIPLDTRFQSLGGIVFRRLRDEVAEDQLIRESEAIDAEFNAMKEELKESTEAGKARIRNAMAQLKAKAGFTIEQIERKMAESQSQLDAKVNKMEEQMKHAGETRKAKLQKRINTIKAEHKLRTEKLKQASKLVREALAVKVEEEEHAGV
jgi:uncharacterized membrane protein